ncbi:MAG: YceI family protein [Chloroflexi bacterium]|nr:YceI family protein [Chloroflexota bacterium]
MMSKRGWIALLTIMLMSTLAACGGTTGTSTAPATSAATATHAATANSATTDGSTACPTVDAASGQSFYNIVSQQTQASYQVQEKFLNRPLPNTAIGKTNSVQGNFLLSTKGNPTITSMKVTVDLRTLTSDEDRRDNSIRGRWLQSDTYPYATFVSTNAQVLSGSYSSGQTITFKLTGNMTIHGVTHQETFNVSGKLVGDTITGTATSLVYMKNYGFDPPNIFGMLTVTDGVTVTLNFTAKAGSCSAS